MDEITRRKIAGLLPELEPDELCRKVRETGAEEDELGGEALLFSREAYGWGGQSGRRIWAARCICTACTEDFETGWVTGGGIRMAQEEESALWPLLDEESGDGCLIVELGEGDGIECPNCGEAVTLTRASRVKYGRTRQLAVQTVHAVEADGVNYAVIMVWMMSRTLYSWGLERDVFPTEAFVLDTDGRLIRLSKAVYNGIGGNVRPTSGWVPKKLMEPMVLRYHDSASNCGCKAGAIVAWKNGRSLDGTTAEKTGLAAYLDAGGKCLVTYLRLWRLQPHVENLVRGGWAHTVRDHVDESVDHMRTNGVYSSTVGIPKILWADMKEAKPSRMLGVPRREVAKLGRLRLSAQTMEQWKEYRAYAASADLAVIAEAEVKLGKTGVQWMIGRCLTAEKLLHYLQKQGGDAARRLHLLTDLWRAADRMGLPRTDEEVRFPRDLLAANDRYHDLCMAMEQEEAKQKYAEGFARIVEKYGYLEYSDGELCAILPRDNGELLAEGKTLRHCVGGYGKEHISENDVIFFIRHARRPERSYYTLDIRMTGKTPKEVQLHGYGNERHGERKQYEHRIPKKVREFCDRWERDILLPRWREEQRRIAKEKKQEARKENVA